MGERLIEGPLSQLLSCPLPFSIMRFSKVRLSHQPGLLSEACCSSPDTGCHLPIAKSADGGRSDLQALNLGQFILRQHKHRLKVQEGFQVMLFSMFDTAQCKVSIHHRYLIIVFYRFSQRSLQLLAGFSPLPPTDQNIYRPRSKKVHLLANGARFQKTFCLLEVLLCPLKIAVDSRHTRHVLPQSNDPT